MPYDLDILAQNDGASWGDLLYLLIFLIFPALNSLGAWIRKKWGSEKEQVVDDDGAVYEVTIGTDGETILTLADKSKAKKPEPKAPTPARPAPAAQPPVARPQPPTRPAAQPQTPTAQPQAQPARPATPARKAPQPARAHPSAAKTPRRARPTRVGESDRHSALMHDDAVEVIPIEETEPDMAPARELLSGESFDKNSLRKAIILSEILAPPLAVRGPSSTPFARPD